MPVAYQNTSSSPHWLNNLLPSGVIWPYSMSFDDRLLPFWGKAPPALGQSFLVARSELTATGVRYHNGSLEADMHMTFYPAATMVYFQCMFASITIIILAGSLLGRMNIKAWMGWPLCRSGSPSPTQSAPSRSGAVASSSSGVS